MTFYYKNFLKVRMALLFIESTQWNWTHGLYILLDQLMVCYIESNHQTPWMERICSLCHLQKVEKKKHLVFKSSLYYEIRGRFHYLYWGSKGSLCTLFHYPNQRWLDLFMYKLITHKWRTLWGSLRIGAIRCITYFLPISSMSGIKCHVNPFILFSHYI